MSSVLGSVNQAPLNQALFRSIPAWSDLPGRGLLRVRGRDAAAFVDKFTTAAVAGLPPGTGTESMFADVRGWVIALSAILRTDDGLMIDCDAAVAASLRDHLDHYHIREDLELVDATREEPCVAVVGPGAGRWLADRGGGDAPAAPFAHRILPCDGLEAVVIAVDWFGPEGFLLRVPAARLPTLHGWLLAGGIARGEAAALDTLRIERRYPAACDVPAKTLPQELDRTARAISFTKGCYLGQETVARIDALGHVNRRLVVVAVAGGEVPPPHAAVMSGDEVLGTLTSTCLSPQLGPCGLALVHRRGLESGSGLTVAGREARLVETPGSGEASG